MEIERWKKDTTPYIVFSCFNCKRWLYVKTIQKTKKCFQCGALHQVKNLKSLGYFVNGLEKAIEIVKINQHNFAIEYLGGKPDFHTNNEFTQSIKKKPLKILNLTREGDFDYSISFQNLLNYLKQTHSQFPEYMITMMAEEFRIPESEIPFLIQKFQNNGVLVALKDKYYSLNKLNY